MARPRLHDPDEVLRNAMVAFWRRGFVATSMADIYAATGLKPGNLYATYTDKDTLFRRAFDAYATQFRASLPTGETGLPAIAAWLRTQARLATEDPERKGCLIINTITEREAHSAETQAMARARMDEIAAFFRDNLAVARDAGEIAPDTDIPRATSALTGAVVAIMSMARGGAPDASLHHIAEAAIAALPRKAC